MTNFCKRFCKSLKVKLIFTSEKLRCAFSIKDPYQSEHFSKVVYKFVCVSCDASYISQTCPHLTTKIDEHFGKDKKSLIYQHLMSSKDCLDKCSKDCFFCFRHCQHQTSIKNKGIPIHHMAETILNNKSNINTAHHFPSKFIFFCSFSQLIWSYRLINWFDSHFQLFLHLIITLLRQSCKPFSFY